jgi:hypothetical protein
MTGALAVAIVGVALAALSLGWQAATFALTGSRVKAELRHGAGGMTNMVTGLPGAVDLNRMRSQGLTTELIGVEVFNRGRLSVSVTAWRVKMGKVAVGAVGQAIGPDLPHRLEPGASATWVIPMQPVRAAVATSAEVLHTPNPDKVWVQLDLGTGRQVKAKGAMEVQG